MKNKELLICPICGVKKVFLGIHLRRVHNILPKDALKKFNLSELTPKWYKKSRSGEGNSFFGKHHSNETKDKIIMKRDGCHYDSKPVPICIICGKRLKVRGAKYCIEHRGITISGNKNPSKRPEVRLKISNSLQNHPTRNKNISKGKMGKPRYDMRGDLNIARRPEVRQKLRDNNSMKRKEVVIKQIRSRCASPNFPEKYLFELVDLLFPNNYGLNPRGEIIRIGNKKPDIVNINGQKKVIEHFGRKWHLPGDEQIKIDHYKKFGFDCLVVWREELDNLVTLKSKLTNFHFRRFNDCNQQVSKEIMVQSDPNGDIRSLGEEEITKPIVKDSNNSDIPLMTTPTLITATDLKAQKGFLSSAAYKVINNGAFCAGSVSGLA